MPSEQTVDATPAPEAPAAEPAGEQKDLFEGFDFGNMDFADTAGQPPAEATETEKKSEPSSPEPVEPEISEPEEPAAAAPVQTAPSEPTPIAPQATVTPAPAQTAQPPVAAQPDTTDYAAQLEEQRERAIGELKKYYALDEKAAERFETEPMEVLSELAARLHLAVVQNTYSAVLQKLPTITHSTMDAINSYQREEEKFYKAWPVFDRNNAEQNKVLMTYGQLFRQNNPSATAEEFTKYVGAAAAAHLGLKSPAPSTGKRKAVPHTPAAAGGGTAPASGSGEPKPTQIEEMIAVWQAGQV